MSRRIVVRFLASLLLLLFSSPAWIQAQDQPGQTAAQQRQDQNQSQTQSDKSVRPTQASPIQDSKPEVKITPREAEELFHSVDEILAFDSKHTGLPIKKQVKRRLTSRDEVVGYLTKHMKDEDVKRLQRSE